MTGAILQLVTNSGSAETLWLNGDPQITFFKTVFRRHSPFSMESVPLYFDSKLDFGTSANVKIRPIGDLAYRMFLSFDIPQLAAVFLNTKSQDIQAIIQKYILCDDSFYQKINFYVTNDNEIDLDQILNLIEEQLDYYDSEQIAQLNILDCISKYKDPIGTKPLNHTKKQFKNIKLDAESSIFIDLSNDLHNDLEYRLPISNTLIKNPHILSTDNKLLKIDLGTKCISQKKEYLLIYELVKLIYATDRIPAENTPVTNTNITKILLNSNIFYDLIPNQEIRTTFYLNQNSTDLQDFNPDSLQQYTHLNSLYPTIPTENFTIRPPILRDPTNTDVYKFPHQCLSDFGESFHHTLNTYNAIIAVLNSLAKTIPIIIAKPFEFSNCDLNYNIYDSTRDYTDYQLNNSYYPTIIDPNYKSNFILNINNIEKPIEDPTFIPINYTSTFDLIYPTDQPNLYLNMFNTQSNTMFLKISASIDILFEHYRCTLFTSTNQLYFNNSATLTNIYSYIIPTEAYAENDQLRISNVFNANIWFFYFFKYLDTINETSFCDHIQKHLQPTISVNSYHFMKNLITLLKINIEYYMNEISYSLNDLYTSSPSTNVSDSLKNYCPISHNTVINNINIKKDLIAITLIFHRNHVPTILEMFQFIYHFISTITIAKMNQYLNINIGHISESECAKIRSIVKLLYYRIFGYFMNVYDNFNFEPPANFSTCEYDKLDNMVIDRFLDQFLLGKDSEYPSISKMLKQMEFYFVAEMIHMREFQKLYYNCLFNKKFILDTIGSGTADIVDMIVGHFGSLCTNYEVDRVRNYWEYSCNSELYYTTTNIDRYYGEAYLNSEYISRNYGKVQLDPVTNQLLYPMSNPPSNPYGINDKYYDNSLLVTDHIAISDTSGTEIPVYWVQSNNCSNVSHATYNNIDSRTFQLFEIDYFRLKHELFYKNSVTNNTHIDEYQFNLLKLLKLTESSTSVTNLHYLHITLFYLIKNTDPGVKYGEQTISDMLIVYLEYVEALIHDEQIEQIDFTNLANHIYSLFESGIHIQIKQQAKPYTANDLIRNNISTLNTNIIDIITTARNNYLSQYFYYIKHYESIAHIHNTQINFMNTTEIIQQLLNISIPSIVYIYPNLFPEQVDAIINYELNDFEKIIFNSLTRFLFPNSVARLTFKDICDMINTIFNSLMQLDTLDLSIWQPLMLDKLDLFNDIRQYLLKKQGYIEPEELVTLAIDFGIDTNDFFCYIRAFVTKYNALTGIDQIMFAHRMLMADLDYFFIKKIDATVLPGITFKKYICEHVPDLGSQLDFIADEYFSYVYFFMLHRDHNIKNPIADIQSCDIDFIFVSDILEYLMDYIVDCAISFSVDSLSGAVNKIFYDSRQIIRQKDVDKYGYMVLDVPEFHAKEDYYFDFLRIKNDVLEVIKDVVRKNIVILDKQKNELMVVKSKIATVMYRNTDAKFAWVRKLAHFLVEEVSLRCGDIVVDRHVSDWLEVYHEISKEVGLEYGYNKMVGNREDLVVYDDKVKNCYKIVLPLIFYCNKHVFSSLPMCASINTKYDITVKFRSLTDVTYKDEFSTFVDLCNLDSSLRENYKPTIENAELMVEYIFLAGDERRIFAANLLEYLIDEVQYQSTTIEALPLSSPSTCFSDIVIQNYFAHPIKFMATIFKQAIHTNPDLRLPFSNYFYGEKQWDNYGLLPYYDLSLIEAAKYQHYNQVIEYQSDLENNKFGFLALLNQLLLKYDNTNFLDREYILESIHRIKDKYLTNRTDIITSKIHTIIYLKEFLLKLSIDYPVFEPATIFQLIKDTHEKITGIVPTNKTIITIINRVSIQSEFNKQDLINIMDQMVKTYPIAIVNSVYDNYNEAVINFIVNKVGATISNINQNFINLFNFFHTQCLLDRSCNQILRIVDIIIAKIKAFPNVEINLMLNHQVKNVVYKDIIHYLMTNKLVTIMQHYLYLLPYFVIKHITTDMAMVNTLIFNNERVEIINYQENMIPNPKINPLISGYLKYEEYDIMPINTTNIMWSAAQAYQYFKHTPSIGINLHSWALLALSNQPSGTSNLSKINVFKSVYQLYCQNQTTCITFALNYNIMRYISGMCGKAWE